MQTNTQPSQLNQVYKHFNIKINIPPVYIGCHKLADRVSTSCGIPMLNKLLGKKRTQALIQAAMQSKGDKYEVKLRGGGKLRFYSK